MLDAESAGFCGVGSTFCPAGEACADGFEDCAFEAWVAVGVCANTAPATRMSMILVRVMELHLPAKLRRMAGPTSISDRQGRIPQAVIRGCPPPKSFVESRYSQ